MPVLLRVGMICFSLMMLVSNLQAQDRENVELIKRISGGTWNSAEAIAIEGDFAYIADEDRGICILDISNPISPTELALFRYTPIIYGIETDEDLVYIAGEEGLVVVDATNPLEPQLLSRFRDIGELRGIVVSGGKAYIARGRNGIAIADISNPEDIRILGELDTPGFSINVSKGENHLYVADRYGGLRIVDVQNPEDPLEVAFLEPEGETRDVTLAGNSAFLAETEVVSHVDIENPENPARLNTLPLNQPAMTISNNDEYIYAGVMTEGLLAISATDDLEIVGRFSRGSPVDMALKDSTVFTVNRSSQLLVIDINDPNDMFEIGQYGNQIDFSAVSIFGDQVYFSTYPIGVIAYDISNPFEPEMIWRDPLYSDRTIGRDLIIQDEYIYVVEKVEHNGRMRIGKLDNPTDSIWISEMYIDDPERMHLDNETLYVTSEDHHFSTIYDVSDPYDPRETGRISTPDGRWNYDIFVRDDIAFIVTERSGLVVKNISDPLHVRDIGSYETENLPNGVVIRDDFAFLACDRSFEIVDISNPREIVRVGICELPGSPREIDLVDNVAFVSCLFRGLYIVNIENFDNPFIIGYYNTPGVAVDVSISGNNAILADHTNFAIFDCSEALGISKYETPTQPASFNLFAAYPNPFNSTTTINYELPNPGNISIKVYNPAGIKIDDLVDGYRQAGFHSVEIGAGGFVSGLYFVTLENGEKMMTQRIILLK